jgi:hypothetical protein
MTDPLQHAGMENDIGGALLQELLSISEEDAAAGVRCPGRGGTLCKCPMFLMCFENMFDFHEKRYFH